MYFLCTIKDIPISKFVDEIYNDIKYVNTTNNDKYDDYTNLFFEMKDDNIKIKYSKTELIRS